MVKIFYFLPRRIQDPIKYLWWSFMELHSTCLIDPEIVSILAVKSVNNKDTRMTSLAIRLKLCGNCLSTKFQTRKFGEITVFFAVLFADSKQENTTTPSGVFRTQWNLYDGEVFSRKILRCRYSTGF